MVEYKGFKIPSSKNDLELMYRAMPRKVVDGKVQLKANFSVTDGKVDLITTVLISNLKQPFDDIDRDIRTAIDVYLLNASTFTQVN